MRKQATLSRLILAVALTLFLSAFETGIADFQILDTLEKEMTKLVENVQPSVVSVMAKCRTPHCNTALASTLRQQISVQGDEFSWRINVGSGFIMDSRGYILTTENVIRNAEELEVTLSNGTTYKAELIGSDPESNIAVLKIDGPHLKPAKLGDSNRLKVGSWITILGNSFGVSSAVSFGLVNGIRKEDDLIQMSAYVSPGNSGAAALNTKGEVIGLVVAAVTEPVTVSIGSPGGQEPSAQRLDLRSHGASLAFPVHKATSIAAELIEHGSYERSWLGVTIQDLAAKLAQKLNVNSGVFVTYVTQPSPASEAGIQPGDVIIEYQKRTVPNGKALVDWVEATTIGDVADMTVIRNGRHLSMKATIGKKPDNLSERMDEELSIPLNYDLTSPTPSSPERKSDPEFLERRIEQLEAEIRRLEKLLRNER